MKKSKQKGASTTSIIGVVLGALALVIAISAYNRAGTDIDEVFETETKQVGQEIRQEAAELGYEARLLSIRASIEAEEDIDQIEADLVQLRAEVNQAAEEAELEARQNLNAFDQELAETETNLRIDTAQALESIDRAIELAQQDLLTEEE